MLNHVTSASCDSRMIAIELLINSLSNPLLLDRPLIWRGLAGIGVLSLDVECELKYTITDAT